jgi:hypothetical protein
MITVRFLVCVLVCVYGGSFQVGFSIGILNTPSSVSTSMQYFKGIFYLTNSFFLQIFREYITKTFEMEFLKHLNEDEINYLWAIINGLLPCGALVGSLGASYIVDYFGR